MRLLAISTLLLLTQLCWAQLEPSASLHETKHMNMKVSNWSPDDSVRYSHSNMNFSNSRNAKIVNEYWTESNTLLGKCSNTFNTKDSTWTQLWTSSDGHTIKLKGRSIGNKLVLESDWFENEDQERFKNRITYTNKKNGRVSQVWNIVDETDHVVRTEFFAVFHRK